MAKRFLIELAESDFMRGVLPTLPDKWKDIVNTMKDEESITIIMEEGTDFTSVNPLQERESA